ncbi:hypothetical protein VPAL9027_00472 [Vibrio palustris]|uniref:Uncharacterized protein n=1 Tax=Vibrio palustris TaxID=1918946 RepID=A0A1R4B0W2_9VIBR|nr:hypothetical protein VPAL9027_00472 [Vibrio palustris]
MSKWMPGVTLRTTMTKAVLVTLLWLIIQHAAHGTAPTITMNTPDKVTFL